jgi:PHD/YefM family antitoxin component YafN of YafNO toxin-antitoxin module
MKELRAVELRQSLRRLAKTLERDGEPILLKVGRRPVGVIVSLRDFRERFALKAAEEERRRLIEEILADRREGRVPVRKVLDELRGR